MHSFFLFANKVYVISTPKKGVIWKRTRKSHKGKQDPKTREIKQADLDMLELFAGTGEIDLKYLDESGFCIWSEPSYTYYQRGKQKCLEQTKRRGRRLSIIGLLQPSSKIISEPCYPYLLSRYF